MLLPLKTEIIAADIIEGDHDQPCGPSKYYDGSSCIVDFTKVALKGAFTKVKTNLTFFNTLHVKNGYVMWDNDLTIDGDFLYEQGEKQEPMQATGYVEKIESHYKTT